MVASTDAQEATTIYGATYIGWWLNTEYIV